MKNQRRNFIKSSVALASLTVLPSQLIASKTKNILKIECLEKDFWELFSS